jgi:hypothetical protein
VGPETAVVRVGAVQEPIWNTGEFLGCVERFGPREPGSLRLDDQRLQFDRPGRPPYVWRLEVITAVQPSSTALQIKAKGQPVAAFRFVESSVRVWEAWIQEAVRRRYRSLGRGEITEFQPRIRTAQTR